MRRMWREERRIFFLANVFSACFGSLTCTVDRPQDARACLLVRVDQTGVMCQLVDDSMIPTFLFIRRRSLQFKVGLVET